MPNATKSHRSRVPGDAYHDGTVSVVTTFTTIQC